MVQMTHGSVCIMVLKFLFWYGLVCAMFRGGHIKDIIKLQAIAYIYIYGINIIK